MFCTSRWSQYQLLELAERSIEHTADDYTCDHALAS